MRKRSFNSPKTSSPWFPTRERTAHFYSGGGEIIAGVVLGQDGQPQRLGTGRPGPFLAVLARRADFQRRHPGTRPRSARCPRAAARDSRRLRAPETEQSLAGYLRLGRSRSGRSRKPRQLPASLFRLFAANHPRCGRRAHPVLSSAGHLAVVAWCAARTGGRRLLLDHEPQRPGEDEVETALRLLTRVIPPIRGPSIWCSPTRFTPSGRFSTFCSLAANRLWWCSRKNGATSIRTWLDYSTMWHLSRVAIVPPVPLVGFSRLTLLAPGAGPGARGSFPGDLHGSPATRQAGRFTTSDWIWATTLPPDRVPVARIVHLGHSDGISRIMASTSWPTNGTPTMCSSMIPVPIECFLLVAFLAYNIFHVFLARNVKPSYATVRRKSSGPGSSLRNSTVRWLPPACRPEVFRTTSSDTSARPGNPHRGLPGCGLFKWCHGLAFAP